MSEFSVPVQPVTQDEINEWYDLQQKLPAIKEREMYLRRKICAHFFKEPREGTNKFPLTEGFVFNMGRVIDRKIDEAQLQFFRDTFQGAGIIIDDIVRMKPELALKAYRDLTVDQQALFDKCLIIKDGAPSLEIVKPKRGGN